MLTRCSLSLMGHTHQIQVLHFNSLQLHLNDPHRLHYAHLLLTLVSVGTHPPEPALTSHATSSVSPTNAAATLTYSPNTQSLLARDKPSSSTSAFQPLPCPTQLFNPSLTTLPATQAFLRDHHCSQSPSFSPRRLRSDTSKKIFRSIRY